MSDFSYYLYWLLAADGYTCRETIYSSKGTGGLRNSEKSFESRAHAQGVKNVSDVVHGVKNVSGDGVYFFQSIFVQCDIAGQ